MVRRDMVIPQPGEVFRHPRLFMYVILAIVMSAYDAVATMQHIARGVAAEGNPLMEELIEMNAALFFLVKMAITALCLLFCYAFAHMRTARIAIQMAVSIYALLSVYHVAIVFFH